MLISAYDKTDRLREMRTRGREGVKNPENFAYVLNGSPLTGYKFDRRRCEREILDLENPLPNRAKNSDNSAKDFPFTRGKAN